MSEPTHEQQLAQLTQEYVSSLPKQLEEISSAWQHRQHVNWDVQMLAKMQLACHSLVGSGAGQKAPEAELTTKSSANTCCIAIIEDDRAQANFLKSRLQQIGYETQLFADPNAFANDTTKRHYDLILLDISFPDGPLEGLFWLEKVHTQLQSHSPIMILSARSEHQQRYLVYLTLDKED